MTSQDRRQQVRPVLARSLQRLLFPPRRDLGMIAGEQHIRNLPAAEFGRPSVVRAFQ